MIIQAINSAHAVPPCQPIKPERAKECMPPIKPAFSRRDPIPVINIDVFGASEDKISEEKFDFACQLAAYYKTQYENLLKDGGVVV